MYFIKFNLLHSNLNIYPIYVNQGSHIYGSCNFFNLPLKSVSSYVQFELILNDKHEMMIRASPVFNTVILFKWPMSCIKQLLGR